jgi:hypothetical protein
VSGKSVRFGHLHSSAAVNRCCKDWQHLLIIADFQMSGLTGGKTFLTDSKMAFL